MESPTKNHYKDTANMALAPPLWPGFARLRTSPARTTPRAAGIAANAVLEVRHCPLNPGNSGHGGQIHVDSRVGEGTTFIATFPVRDPS